LLLVNTDQLFEGWKRTETGAFVWRAWIQLTRKRIAKSQGNEEEDLASESVAANAFPFSKAANIFLSLSFVYVSSIPSSQFTK
jgi:hypothetical protein